FFLPSKKEIYKIYSFDSEVQQLLKTALKDPSSVELEKVANIIVDQSLKDCVFSKEAGCICYAITPVESNMPMMALVNPIYDCLFLLAQPDSLQKEEEVDCLVLVLHHIGEQLEKMNSQRTDELFPLLHDAFLLQEGLSSLSQLLLPEVIEFWVTDWKMTEAAQKHYYSEVTN
uniref:Uncharacterized protein n=1 Tax=Pseudonaja textilis TaxID=8673 RepID=A0A670XV81_PSETE